MVSLHRNWFSLCLAGRTRGRVGPALQQIEVRDQFFYVGFNCNSYVVTDGEDFWQEMFVQGVDSIGHFLAGPNQFYIVARVKRRGALDGGGKHLTFTLLASSDLKEWKNVGFPPLPL